MLTDLGLGKNGKHVRLYRAALTGKLEKVKKLIAEGADPNSPHARYNDWTPLTAACEGSHVDVVKFLVQETTADIHAKNHAGKTPLLLAVSRGNVEMARVLITAGARIQDTNNNGWSSLDLAVACAYSKMAELLIDAGAEVTKDMIHKVDKPALYEMLKSAYQKQQPSETVAAAPVESFAREGASAVSRTKLLFNGDVTLREVFDFQARKLTTFIEKDKIPSAPTITGFDDIRDLGEVEEAYAAHKQLAGADIEWRYRKTKQHLDGNLLKTERQDP